MSLLSCRVLIAPVSRISEAQISNVFMDFSATQNIRTANNTMTPRNDVVVTFDGT